jgi:protein involved in temperature-dependent protein secretion
LARVVAKKSNATPKELAKQLIALKSDYEKAAKQGNIVIVDSID